MTVNINILKELRKKKRENILTSEEREKLKGMEKKLNNLAKEFKSFSNSLKNKKIEKAIIRCVSCKRSKKVPVGIKPENYAKKIGWILAPKKDRFSFQNTFTFFVCEKCQIEKKSGTHIRKYGIK